MSREGMIINNEGSLLDVSNEERLRDTAQVFEELQRAQADNLTDDEFDELHENA